MSVDSGNNQVKGRPSENGKASFSVVRGGASRPRSGAHSRGTYESDAQALADIWDPKKRKEREEAAAAEAAAAVAAEAAKREEERVAREKAAREKAAREQAAREQAAKAAAQSATPTAESDFLDTLADSRKRLASLPEIGEPKKLVDLRAAIPVIADPAEDKESAPQDESAPVEAEVAEQASSEEAAADGEDPEYDPEATADLPVIGLEEDDEFDKSDEDGEDESEGEQAQGRPSGKPVRRKSTQKGGTAVRKPARKKGKGTWKIVLGVVLALVIVFGAAAGYASLMRWVLVDDEADIQGSWHLSAQPVSMVVTGDHIDLARDVSYSYTIDTQAKVIFETFGNMKGASRYRFSEDRNSVALFDDASTDWWGNALKDLQWYLSSFFAKTFNGKEPDLLGGESGIVMYREGFDAPGVVTSSLEPEAEPAAEGEPAGENGEKASEENPNPEAEEKASPAGA